MKPRHRNTRTIDTAELVALFAHHGEITPQAATRLLRTFAACIIAALQYGHTVRVRKLGLFTPQAIRAHAKMGGKIAAKESAKVKFTPTAYLLKAMQDSYYHTQPGREKLKAMHPPTEPPLDAAAAAQIDVESI